MTFKIKEGINIAGEQFVDGNRNISVNAITTLGTTSSTSPSTGALVIAGGVGIGENLNIGGNLTLTGNLTVNGVTTTLDTAVLSIDDKNIELGAVAGISNLTATLSLGVATVTLSSTTGLIPGQALTKVSGTGNFGASPVILSVDSKTQITLNVNHAAAGAITFNVGGATDTTANGGGITLKGTTDKTINWLSANTSWTSSENFNLVTGKDYRINGTSVLSSSTLGSGVTASSLTSVGTLTSGTWNANTVQPTYGGTGVNNGSRTITLGGNLTTSGAFNTTITVSGDTSVTLPTSGTLATTGNLSQFAATTSAQLAGVISDETGSGSLVFATSPTLTTPTLGAASATTINKVTITEPATGATLTIANGKTFAVSNTLTLEATDGTTVNFGSGGTLAYATGNLSQFAATTSAQLAGVISDETGSGSLVFATSPTLTTPTISTINGSTAASGTLTLRSTTNATKATAGILIDEAIASSSVSTGALVVSAGLGVGGQLTTKKLLLEGSREKLTVKSGASGTVDHDYLETNLFFHVSPAADFVLNFTNIPADNDMVTVMVVMIQQGATPYIPSSVTIAGVAVTVEWLANVPGFGTGNNLDVFSYIIIRRSSTWKVIANIASYGTA